jgi:hypothetical protein
MFYAKRCLTPKDAIYGRVSCIQQQLQLLKPCFRVAFVGGVTRAMIGIVKKYRRSHMPILARTHPHTHTHTHTHINVRTCSVLAGHWTVADTESRIRFIAYWYNPGQLSRTLDDADGKNRAAIATARCNWYVDRLRRRRTVSNWPALTCGITSRNVTACIESELWDPYRVTRAHAGVWFSRAGEHASHEEEMDS